MQQLISSVFTICVRLISFISHRSAEWLLSKIPRSLKNFNDVVSYRGSKFIVYTGESVGRRMYYYHDFESEQSQILISLAVQGGIFFDIGANIGFYSILMAKRGMKVVAFEPFPKLCDFIVGNVTLNEVRDRVSIVPEALSDSCGVTVYNPPREGNWGVGKIFGKNLDSSKEVNVVNPSIEVKTLTLDDAVKKYGLPSVMKVDIEGAEYLLLHNKPSILYTDNAPTIFIEFHPSEIELLGGSVAQLKDIFHNAGYQEYEVNQHQSTVHEWRIFSKSAVGSEFRRVDQ